MRLSAGEKRLLRKEGRIMNKIFRSRTQRMVAGVCGGIGEYFGIDPTIVRLGFVLLSLMVGGGLLVYILAAIILPEEATVQ